MYNKPRSGTRQLHDGRTNGMTVWMESIAQTGRTEIPFRLHGRVQMSCVIGESREGLDSDHEIR